MINFDFQCKTEIIFGKGTEHQVGKESKRFGTRVLLIYGGGNIKKTGLYNSVTNSLKEENLFFTELSGVEPNPLLSLVKKGIKLCRDEKIDFLLAVGGGSVIDTAKAISAGFYYDGDVWDFFQVKAIVEKTLPIGVISTIAAAGSETSKSAVITNADLVIKKGLNSDLYRPVFAIMNPELTYTLPLYQTMSGVADIMSHLQERYFTDATDNELSTLFTESALKVVIHNALIVKDNPADYNARAQLFLASTLGHNGMLAMGRIGDFGTHRVEHELSALFGVTHGAGIAVITLAWMKYVIEKKDPQKVHPLFVRYAKNIWDVPSDFGNDKEIALEGVSRLEKFFKSVSIPVDLASLNVPTDEKTFNLMAEKCTAIGPQGQFYKIYKDDAIEIYRIAAGGKN